MSQRLLESINFKANLIEEIIEHLENYCTDSQVLDWIEELQEVLNEYKEQAFELIVQGFRT